MTGLVRNHGTGHRRAVVCLHHAGGGISAFRTWPQALGSSADVLLVQLEGREDRVAERLSRSLGDLAAEIATKIWQLAYDEIVLVGHSMGATIAWSVAEAMWSIYRTRPAVVLSAQLPPPYNGQSWRLPVPSLVVPGAPVPGSDPLNAAVLAADLDWILREFPGYAPRRLPVDLWCVAAERDELIDPGAMAGWAALTTGSFTELTVPGDHMYLLTDPAPLISLVGAVIMGGARYDVAAVAG